MWTRVELKEKAKQRFKANYWKCVLVALLLALLGGGASTGTGTGGTYTGMRDTVNHMFDSKNNHTYNFNRIYNDWGEETDDWDDDWNDEWDNDTDVFLDDLGNANPAETAVAVAGIAVIVILVIVIVIIVVLLVVIPLQVFIFNPLEVGMKHFFVKNLWENAKLKEITYAFDHNYMNCVKTMFFRDLYVFLWSLLFIIPGIIKSYEYRMIPYILGDNPNMGKEEAFAVSSAMMQGNKWDAFVLDLSFLGWYILNGMTFGILGIFYVNPYVNQTNAALYQKLKSLQTIQQEPMNMTYQA